MIARSGSWPASGLRPEARRTAAAAALGVGLFLASFGLLHVGPFGGFEITDTAVYQRYGDAVLDRAQVPYRDFQLEYPPGALPVFIVPSLAGASDYRTAFEIEMLVFGAIAVGFVVLTLASVGSTPGRLYGGAALAGLAPLALGSVVLTRFDLWPAALAAAALFAIVAGHPRLGLGALAVGAGAKVWPAVLLPIALFYVRRRFGGRAAALAALVFLGVLACIVVPFALLSPGGFWESVERQSGRPLQVEALGSAALLAGHQLGAYDPFVVSSYGSQNLDGELPAALGTVQSILQVLLVVGLWVAYIARREERADPNRFLAVCAAAIAIFVAFGKVLSPQFLIWLVPLVPLVAGRRGLAAGAVFLCTLVLTQLWFPKRYWDLVAFEAYPTWLLLARDSLLILLAGLLATATARGRARPRSP